MIWMAEYGSDPALAPTTRTSGRPVAVIPAITTAPLPIASLRRMAERSSRLGLAGSQIMHGFGRSTLQTSGRRVLDCDRHTTP